MIQVLEDFQVCTDCHLGIAGYSEEELGYALINFGARFTPGVHYVTGELLSDFSSLTCGSCGTDLAGERYSAFGLGEPTADSTTKSAPIVMGTDFVLSDHDDDCPTLAPTTLPQGVTSWTTGECTCF